MKELISKMKAMNDECSRALTSISNKEILISQLTVIVFSMRDAMNEMAIDIIKLEDEVTGYGKGEI
jgi:hypothetical protein